MDEMDVMDKINDMAVNMDGLTALLHMVYEGIRTDNVGLNEIIEAVNCLYKTAESLNGQLQKLRNEFCP
ncbi:hypothetical protein D7V86_15230 [bacterium D16-51]|nr:hypothetical protein D7V96_20645 [bacterium D16-59]RKI58778.1 hypothetical protein D7V86_15230 [bacterium D16-51]